jgi:hypothetical protein
MGFEGSSGWHGPSAGGGGGAIPLAQGEIYVDDNANTQTLTNQNTFYKLTAPTWSAGTNNGFTPNLGSQEIQCNGDGTYLVVCQGDIIAQNNEQIEFALFVNNVEQINFESLVTGRGGAQHSSWGYNGFVILSVGDIVDVRVQCTSSAGETILLQHINLSLQASAGATGATGATGAGGALGYWGSFWSTDDQIAANTTTAYPITLNNTDPDSNGVSIVSSSRLTFAYAGVYNIQFSAQADRISGSGTDTIDIWFRKNGTDVADSNTVVTVSGSALAAKTVAAWNYMAECNAGDYVELMWRTSDTRLELVASAAGIIPIRPAVPSVILTASQVMYTQIAPSGNPNISVTTDTVFLEVQSGMTNLNSLYTVDGLSFDRYRISAIVPKTSMSGNNTYVFYLGTVFDPDNTLTFKV